MNDKMLTEFESKELRHRLECTCSRCDRCFDTITDMKIHREFCLKVGG